MLLPDSTLKELLKGLSPEQITGKAGLFTQLQKQLLEAALRAEMTDHLGYDKHEKSDATNARNGFSKKTLKGQTGEMEIKIPRDRNAEFEPLIVKKNQTRFKEFDGQIISLFARGMTTREIQEHLKEMYDVDVSPTLISNVTEEVLVLVNEWQNRPLEEFYPVVYMDALWVKVRHEKRIINKAVHICLAINTEGRKEVLGMWIATSEGASFWHQILTDLATRGVTDICVACVDGLKGFPAAIQAVFPKTAVQTCIVHMIRNSLRFVNYKQRSAVIGSLKDIYKATSLDQAEIALSAFEDRWDATHPDISRSWRRNWPEITTFFAYPPAIRKILYTTNPLESVNAAIRKVTRNRLIFPHDTSVHKLFYLALDKASKKWKAPVLNWKAALGSFIILYQGPVPSRLTQSS